jgi:glycosyltransferase involved in cell wall biosynthesis
MRQGDIKQMVAEPITVVQLLPDLNTGGVERGTLEIGNYLSVHGHRSFVVSGGGRMVSSLEKGGSRHVTRTIGVKSPAVLGHILPLWRFLKEEKVDILHARSRLPAWIGYLAWKSLPLSRRPRFVTTFHGFYSINKYSAVMTKGERVIAISRGVGSHIVSHYGVPREKIALIYRGFDETQFDPVSVDRLRLQSLRHRWRMDPAHGPVIMLPGRLSRWKGQDVFIKSLSKIKHLTWSALCVGDFDENAALKNTLEQLISREGLENRVRFVGHCGDMPAAMMLADVVVSASSTEPEAFGRIAVEAQAMGKPVIATAHGGSLETVRDRQTGWLVKPCDVRALSGAMADAIENPLQREQFGKRGYAWVRDHFSVNKMCEKTLLLYRQLIRKG